MAIERVLNCVTEYKTADTAQFFQFLNGLSLIHLGQIFDVKAVARFENGLQVLLDANCGSRGIREIVQHLAQLRDGRDPYFVPVVVGFVQPMIGFIGGFVAGVFQAAGVQKGFDDRPAFRRTDGFVVLFDDLLQQLDTIAAILIAHGSVF